MVDPPRRSVRRGSCPRCPLWEIALSRELADLIAKRFIARTDVKAVQSPTKWSPHTVNGRHDGDRIKWGRADLMAHLAGEATYGHYMLNTDNQCKLFAFDIDLRENKPATDDTPGFQGQYYSFEDEKLHDFDPRADWLNRRHPGRDWSKYQLKMVATMLAARITDELEIPAAVAYSGSKGLHVYGFTGLAPASDAIEAAHIVLDSTDAWEPSKGKHFFRSTDQDPTTGFPNLEIEVFPKQATLSNSEGLGNLMRLPLGKNLKSKDPTFFVDMTSPMGQMVPVDPIWALTTSSPWKSPR